MAGRGVDILLGGNAEYMAREQLKRAGVEPAKMTPEAWDKALADAAKITKDEHEKVIALGGLHITGTERHEARRIDNQLRGRAGRQGDPGSSRFFLSLEDDLMRIFGSERISGLMARIGMGDGVPIEHRMVSKAIERAQKQVEGQNFSIRKHLLEYDDVMNKQRSTIYTQRREILEGKDMKSYVQEIAEQILDWLLDSYVNKDKSPDDWDIEAFRKAVAAQFGVALDELGIKWDEASADEVKERVHKHLLEVYERKETQLGAAAMREFERIILLQVIDTQWKDHLLGMDYLKEGIGLRGYGQRDPLIEYKKESFDMFQAMLDRIEDDTIRYLYLIQPVAERPQEMEMAQRKPKPVYYQQPHAAPAPKARQARSMIPSKRKKR